MGKLRCHWRLRPQGSDGCAPSAPTLWTSHTRDPEPLLSPGVPLGCPPHCRVCVRHSRAGGVKDYSAHLQTNCGQRAFTTCDVAQETLLSEFDQHLTTASPRAAQWARGSSQKESYQQTSQLPCTSHQSGFAFVVLNAGTAGLKHLPDFSIGTADLVKLKLLHWEREKRRPRPTRDLL